MCRPTRRGSFPWGRPRRRLRAPAHLPALGAPQVLQHKLLHARAHLAHEARLERRRVVGLGARGAAPAGGSASLALALRQELRVAAEIQVAAVIAIAAGALREGRTSRGKGALGARGVSGARGALGPPGPVGG